MRAITDELVDVFLADWSFMLGVAPVIAPCRIFRDACPKRVDTPRQNWNSSLGTFSRFRVFGGQLQSRMRMAVGASDKRPPGP